MFLNEVSLACTLYPQIITQYSEQFIQSISSYLIQFQSNWRKCFFGFISLFKVRGLRTWAISGSVSTETEPEVNCGDSTIGGKRKIDSNDDAVWRLVKSEKHKTTPRPGIEPGPPG